MSNVTWEMMHRAQAKAFTELFLEKDGAVQLVVMPFLLGVEIPDGVRGEELVVLDIDSAHPIPPQDLSCDEDALRVTLSFNRTPFKVVLPWGSLRSIQSLRGKVASEQDSPSSDTPAQPSPLRSIKGGKSDA